MAGELVVANNQYQLRDLLIGVGTKYRWQDTPPTWWGAASMRTSDTPYSAAHGVRGGRDLLGSKQITGKLVVLADTPADLQACLDALAAAWAPSDDNLPFVAQLLGSKRRRYGRPRRLEAIPDRLTLPGNLMVVAVEFDALDPYVYSDAAHSVAISLPVAGGASMPMTLPVTLAAGTPGVGSIVNAGTIAAPWTAQINGPIVNPAITHLGQNRTLDFDVNGGLTLGASDFLLIDSQTRSVLFNGTADRRNTLDLGSQWFSLDPGSNAISFAADSGSGSFTITWRDAYL